MLNSGQEPRLERSVPYHHFQTFCFDLPMTSAIGPDLLRLQIYCGAITVLWAYSNVPSHFLKVVVNRSISTTVQFSVPTNTRSPTSKGCCKSHHLLVDARKRRKQSLVTYRDKYKYDALEHVFCTITKNEADGHEHGPKR